MAMSSLSISMCIAYIRDSTTKTIGAMDWNNEATLQPKLSLRPCGSDEPLPDLLIEP